MADAGGPYTSNEGDSLTLDASQSFDPDAGDSITSYSWTINGHPNAASGVTPTLTWAQVQVLGVDDGPNTFTVSVTVTDTHAASDTASTSLTLNNAPPTASFGNSPTPSVGKSFNLVLNAMDPSTADQTAGFTFVVTWGDGTATTTTAAGTPSGTSVPHTYSSVGPYTVTLTATDKDSGTSTQATTTITVSGVQTGPDPGDASKTALFVSGTGGNDTITVTKVGSKLRMTLNGTNLGSFTMPTGHLIVFGQEENDTITIDPLLTVPRIIYGGDGNDSITGGNGSGLDLGGAGNDTISTGSARDILIGGAGADTLNGGNGDDILVAGSTSYDAPTPANMRSLFAIQAEWTRTDQTYQQRINHLIPATSDRVV